MAGFGKRVAKEILNLFFGKTTAFSTSAGVLYISLHTGDPGEDGQTANEVSGGSYARKSTAATDWNAATDADPSVTTNATDLTFVTATGAWGTITHFGVWTHASNATEAEFLYSGSLSPSQAVVSGNTVSFPAASLQFTLD